MAKTVPETTTLEFKLNEECAALLRSINVMLQAIASTNAAMLDLIKRQAETDPMAILNAALKAEQGQGR
jgi:hypothetical protein